MTEQTIDWKTLIQKAMMTGNKDIISRVSLFQAWVKENQQQDIPAETMIENYSRFLCEQRGLSDSSVRSHLSSVLRKLEEAGTACHRGFQPRKPKELSVLVNQVSEKPREDERLRLNEPQIAQLLAAPNRETLKGSRDAALIALMLATGIRESEVVMLDTHHLVHNFEGDALHVPASLGCKERLIPYGGMRWVIQLVEEWMSQANIHHGPIFRGFYKGGKHVRPTRMTIRTVENILTEYPVTIDGQEVTVKLMDLRRTYAFQLYKSGVGVTTLQEYLGLGSAASVLEYVGYTEEKSAVPPLFFQMPEA